MPLPYRAYLLRLWLAGSHDRPSWRAALEDPHTRQVTSFSSIEALCEFLIGLKNAEGNTPEADLRSSHPNPNELEKH